MEDISENSGVLPENKKKKKERHPKETKNFIVHPSITYLDSYEKGENWKFNKNQQTYIIENILSRRYFPLKSFKQALKYFCGLKGGSRDFLMENCTKAIKQQREKEINDLGDDFSEKKLEEEQKIGMSYPKQTFYPN